MQKKGEEQGKVLVLLYRFSCSRCASHAGASWIQFCCCVLSTYSSENTSLGHPTKAPSRSSEHVSHTKSPMWGHGVPRGLLECPHSRPTSSAPPSPTFSALLSSACQKGLPHLFSLAHISFAPVATHRLGPTSPHLPHPTFPPPPPFHPPPTPGPECLRSSSRGR